ncbi:response regulator [Paenibacillus doosanensis]|uniref:response regulator transcription factor n=1 Tax=Paenibacillus doosanensis TaxID=1229154 RepID=UPI00217F5E3F|nr:helix-turn-helix domain-containing protein [Paenibacillus doosanensis]MCS7461370.1 response regulator [Paenibacillus doosanensis]
MLLKVIAVDDELLVRNHLRSLIDWEQFGFTLCGEAGDGAEALELVRDTAPHLAIVDMNMPGMDGVELIRQLSERCPELRMIALSSYDSYEYVRGSLHFGAVDYLLKHRLSPETLVQVLSKVKEKVRVELKQQTDRERERLKWEAAVPAVNQSYLKELLIGAGAADESKYVEHFRDLPYGRDSQRHVLLLMKLMNFEELHMRMNEQELTLFIRSVTDMTLQIIADAGCAVYLERGTFGVLLSMEHGRSENEIQQQVEGKKARLKKSLELYFNCSVLFVQTGIFRTLAAISAQYVRLQGKLDELQGHTPKAERAERAVVSYVTISQEKELLAAAEACDAEELSRIVRDVAQACDADRAAYPRGIARAGAELMHLAVKIAQKAGIESEWIVRELSGGPADPKDGAELESTYQALFAKLAEALSAVQTSARYSRYVAQAIRRIQQNYRQGITLEETAEQLGITPSYLSRLFKEEHGMTFTEYLTAYRIDRSAQLIRTRACSVKEIYHLVGFNSYSYFIKVFKEHIGETPHVYAGKYGK